MREEDPKLRDYALRPTGTFTLLLHILAKRGVITEKECDELRTVANYGGELALAERVRELFDADQEYERTEIGQRAQVGDMVKHNVTGATMEVEALDGDWVLGPVVDGMRQHFEDGEYTIVKRASPKESERAQVGDTIRDKREPRVQFTVGYVGENYAFESPKKLLGTWMCKHGNYTIVKRASDGPEVPAMDVTERARIGDVIRRPQDAPSEIVVSRIEEKYVEGFERDERFRAAVTHRPNRRACHGDYEIVKRPEIARAGDEVELDVELLSYLPVGPACLFALGNGQYTVSNVTDEHAEVEDEGRTWQLPHGWYKVVKRASDAPKVNVGDIVRFDAPSGPYSFGYSGTHCEVTSVHDDHVMALDKGTGQTLHIPNQYCAVVRRAPEPTGEHGPFTMDEQGNVIPYPGEVVKMPEPSTAELVAMLAKREGIRRMPIGNGTAYSVNICEPKDEWRMRDYGGGPATILVVPGESE